MVFEKSEKCHANIVEYIKIAEIKSDKLFTVFINDKKGYLLICKKHSGLFIYFFYCICELKTYEFPLNKKLTSLCKKYLLYCCTNYYCNFQHVSFSE